MNEPKKKAVIYCRVSTKEQVEEGNSLATQERVCKEYALKHGYEIINLFREEGESAKTTDRTQLKLLLQFCAVPAHGVTTVIAYKLDRISRNTYDYSCIRLMLKQCGVEIKSTSESFGTDPAGKFMENMIANVAQFDNDVRTERSMNGMIEAMREGRYVWRAAVGYSNMRIRGKSNIVPNSMASVVQTTFKEIAKNLCPSDIVRQQMNEAGLKMPSGRSVSKSYFYHMLRNKVYTGWIIKFGESHKGVFEPIISEELFEQVQLVLKHRKPRNYIYQTKHPDFPLRKFFSHPSGFKLTGCWSRGRSKLYAYYLFKQAKLQFTKEKMEAHFKQILNECQLSEQYYTRLCKAVQLKLVKENKKSASTADALRAYVAELKQNQGKLVQKNLQGVISDTVLAEQLKISEREIMQANTSLFSIPDTYVDYENVLSAVKRFITHPAEMWEKFTLDKKLKLQWFYFPHGIVFDGIKSRTAEICRLFKYKMEVLAFLSDKAALLNQNPNHLAVTPPSSSESEKEFWHHLGQELIILHELFNDSDH